MSGAGRPAAQPPAGWRPAARRDGLRVRFVSEDGLQHKLFDFSVLPCQPQVREELAIAFEAATGPLGRWKRQASAKNLWRVAHQASRWLAQNRPGLSSLEQLSGADARMLAMTLLRPSGDQMVATFRALLRYSPAVAGEVGEALVRVRGKRSQEARQPYTAEELRRITVVARGIVRRARARLRTHWGLVADYQAGRGIDRDPRDPQWRLAQALHRCAGDGSRASMAGTPSDAAQDVGAGDERRLLHLTAAEAWGFSVLLTALTGLNASVLSDLPAPHLRASAPHEPMVALVDVLKPRRGARSAMTLPLTGLPRELFPAVGDARPAGVLNTSLTSAVGVFGLLVELTEPARRMIGSQRAFVCYTGQRRATGAVAFREGLQNSLRLQRLGWLRGWLTGDAQHDELLVGISLDRLRKTYLEQHRRPVAHTPDTLARYLRRMHPVTQKGYQVVREALDEQASAALARRQMTVTSDPDGTADTAGQDTVLNACADFDHSPLDDGRSCRQTFLSCLDCGNARAFPRHLPLQLLVLDELRAQRATMPLERWVAEIAGRVAQLEGVVDEYEPAQRELARTQITDGHRRLVAQFFSGDLDPL